MKVLHILNELKFSGAEIMYVAAASDFKELGCELYVVNTSPSMGEYAPYFADAGYKVLHWPYRRNFSTDKIKYIRQVIAFLKEERVDVVHIHRSDMQWIMSFCAWKAGCKAVYTFHNVFPSRWYSRIYHILQRLSAKNIFGCRFQTISDSVYLHEKNFFHNDTLKIYNWYATNRYYPALENEKYNIRRLLNINESALVLISVGGCSPIKRHSDIIKALPIILEEYSDTIYLHLGMGDALQEEISLAKELKVDKSILFMGNQTDVRRYLIASDIYLMPSKFEGIPITTIEALACKIPAILYNVPGLSDFNKTKKCSVLIEESFETMAKSILQLFKDKDLQSEISDNGKSLVDEHFNMKTNVQKIYNLYLGQ